MPYAVVLYLDESADRLVREIWTELHRRGVSSPGREETGNRPHVTLALFDDCDPVRVTTALAPVLGAAAGVPLELASVGLFLGPRAPAFLGVVPSSALLDLHRQVQGIIHPLVSGNSHFYESPSWLPHCTIAMQALNLATEIIAAIAERALPIRAHASRARLVWLPDRAMTNALVQSADILSGLRPPAPSWDEPGAAQER